MRGKQFNVLQIHTPYEYTLQASRKQVQLNRFINIIKDAKTDFAYALIVNLTLYYNDYVTFNSQFERLLK